MNDVVVKDTASRCLCQRVVALAVDAGCLLLLFPLPLLPPLNPEVPPGSPAPPEYLVAGLVADNEAAPLIAIQVPKAMTKQRNLTKVTISNMNQSAPVLLPEKPTLLLRQSKAKKYSLKRGSPSTAKLLKLFLMLKTTFFPCSMFLTSFFMGMTMFTFSKLITKFLSSNFSIFLWLPEAHSRQPLLFILQLASLPIFLRMAPSMIFQGKLMYEALSVNIPCSYYLVSSSWSSDRSPMPIPVMLGSLPNSCSSEISIH